MSLRIKKNDLVIVLSGEHKGDKGRVMEVLPSIGKVLVEGVNKVKRHTRPTVKNREGGIIEKEAPLPISKVAIVDTKTDKATRFKASTNADGKKIRVASKSGSTIDG